MKKKKKKKNTAQNEIYQIKERERENRQKYHETTQFTSQV